MAGGFGFNNRRIHRIRSFGGDYRVTTSITLVGTGSKRILRAKGDGWRRYSRNWHQRASDGRTRRKFERKKEEAIAALLTKRSLEEAAQAAGIGTRTLMRWLKIPEFQKAYREARRPAFGRSIARLQQATSAAACGSRKFDL